MRLAGVRSLSRLLLVLLVPLAVLVSPGSSGAQAGNDDAGDRADRPVYVLRITGTIDLGSAPYVDRVVQEAEDRDAAAIIIEIDTPGGRLDAVIQMRDAIIGTSVRTIALVDASAYSAGALVAISSDEIYMTPGSVLGAATPVQGDTGEVADEKTISAVRAAFESAAEANGRDPQVAAAMVDTRVAVDGLVSDQELLTLTAVQASEFGYSEGTVAGRDALLTELGLEDNELVVTSLGFAEQLVRFLTNPIIAGLLLLAGSLLIISDLFSGGLGLGAVTGAAVLALFFWGHLFAGLAGWEDVALVVVGLALLAVEVFVVPGFGVPGVLGIISIGTGAFLAMLYRDFDFVSNDDIWRAGVTALLSMVGAVVGLVLLITLLSRRGAPSSLVLSARLGPGEPLTTRSSSGWLRWLNSDVRLESDRVERPDGAPVEPEHSLVGSFGTAVSDLRPGGIVEIDGHRVDVITSGEFVPAGSAIEVVRDERYRRVVRRRA